MNKEIPDTKYVEDYYDEFLKSTKEEYANLRWFDSDYSRYEYKQTKRAICKALKSRTFNKVLEVGPGDGVWTEIFAERAKMLTALDVSSSMINRAKKRLARFRNIEFIHGDFLANNLPSTSYDLACAVRCFEYFPDKQKSIQEMNRVLEATGAVLIITKNPFYRWRILRGAERKLLHSDQVPPHRLRRLFEEEGFVVRSLWPAVLGKKLGASPARLLFDMLHKISLSYFGWIVPGVFQKYFAESYLMYAIKK